MSQLFKGMERIEEAREQMVGESFMAGLFMGTPNFNLLFPPEEPVEEKEIGEEYCKKIEEFLKRHVDPGKIERTAKIPESSQGPVGTRGIRDENTKIIRRAGVFLYELRAGADAEGQLE